MVIFANRVCERILAGEWVSHRAFLAVFTKGAGRRGEKRSEYGKYNYYDKSMRLIRMRYLQNILIFQRTGRLRLTHEGIIIYASAVNYNYED